MRETLEFDDVVFMYAASEPETYQRYGATVLAWGGAHTQDRVKEMEELGVHATGTMWCLTATAVVLHEDADLREATARDIEGNPIIVPWQRDKVHEGTPTWWGCTNHPTFRAHSRKRVCEAMAGGAKGLHVDDHLGVAHPTIGNGGCFCDYCMQVFCDYLIEHDSSELRKLAGVSSFDGFDYREHVKLRATTRDAYLEIQAELPLNRHFIDCQLQRAAEHTRQLGALAEQIVERPVTLSANTGLPSLNHTVVTPHLSYLVGEVNHRAEEGTDGLINAVRAYRMAESIGRPIASTASGGDWAFVKVTGCVNLVCVWIALGYACGQRLMAPHRQWCHTQELGSHWYAGPSEVYVPLYRFVRENRKLFLDCVTAGALAPPRHVPERFDTFEQREALLSALDEGDPQPASASERIWQFPRLRSDGALVVHLVNLDYSPGDDMVNTRNDVTVNIDFSDLERQYTTARLYSYDAKPVDLEITSSAESTTTCMIRVPEQRIWSVVELT